MKKRYKIFVIVLFVTIIGISMKLYLSNKDLKSQINEREAAYQELRIQKLTSDYTEAKFLNESLIAEKFSWLHSKDVNKITLENYDGNTLYLMKNNLELNNIILQGLASDNNIIESDNIISVQLHDDIRFYYTLRYYIEDKVYELFIYDDGTIKYEDTYYESPVLLSVAQSLMPIINDRQNEIQMEAIDAMLNSYIATYAEYKAADVDKSNYKQNFDELWDNAVRLRASAYYIKENMIQSENVDKNIESMRVSKSSGFSGGKQVDMYIYTNKDTISYVKLVYNNLEKTYILKPTINEKLKCFPLINIWTAS